MSANMIAGPIAGAITCFMFYPFDTLKTRLQSPEYRRTVASKGARRVWFRGLYQGAGPIVLATLPASAVFFTVYQESKQLIHEATPSLPNPVVNCIGSSIAELIASAVATPAEVIKQNAQVLSNSGSGGSSSLQALRLIGRDPRNLWRGYTLFAGRNLPFIALQFPIYEELKTFLGSGGAQDDWWEVGKITGIAAVGSGGMAAFITTPIDVMKTRVMLSAANKGGKIGMRGMFKEILREEGFKGLFRGGVLRTVWTAIGSGVYLALYEVFRKCK